MPHVFAPRTPRRPRTLALLAVALVATAVVVLVNHGGGSAGTAAGQRTRASMSPSFRAAGDPPATPVPSGLEVLHATYRFVDSSPLHPGVPDLTAADGVLLDVDTERILWERNPHDAVPPASTTKVFSALVALENLDPEQWVDVTPDALFAGPDETRLGIQAGDHYTVRELLQAMLTISANDAADVLAVDTVGLQRFVTAMNEQVAALGLRDSHFVSPVGLDDPRQRASAYDLGVAGLAAYEHFAALRDIVGRASIDVPATSGHVAYTLHNLNRLLGIYPPALGIKPGWTGDAGYCLVAMAERGGHRLVAVLMNDPHLYSDARALFEWGFEQLGIAPLPTATPSPRPAPHH